MKFIAFRVFLSNEPEKLVVAPDLIEKERRRFLTMVLDRGYSTWESNCGKGRWTVS
jgi:hypothetical protein